jgi:hypothetical protein
MNENSVELEFRYDPQDLCLSYLVSYFTYGTVWNLFLGFAIYGLFLAFIFLKGDPQFLQILGTLMTAFVSVILLGLFNSYLSATSRSVKRKSTFKFVFEPDQVYVSTDNTSCHIKWGYFLKVTESKSRFRLYTRNKEEYWLPKRAFANGDIDKLRQLMLSQADAVEVRLKPDSPRINE